MNESEVMIDYTNWKGERGIRRIRPREFQLGGTYHKGWVVLAFDVAKQDIREFALAGIHSWREVE